MTKPAEQPSPDPVGEALDRAPIGEPWTPEQCAELDQAMEDIRAGRARLVAHEDLPQALEEIARAHAG
jgi:hypothetical protein